MNHEHIEAATTSAKIMYGGAGGTVLFGLTASEIGAYCALASLFVTVIAACYTIYFKHQANKRAQEIHELKINNHLRTNFFDDDENL